MSLPPVTQQLVDRLTAAGVAFDLLRHPPVFTSAQAAEIRGTSLASGAKALVCKVDDQFLMFVLPADLRLNGKQARQWLGARGLRFADRDEVAQLTGLTPGSIPPFGSLFSLPTHCDQLLLDHPRINFNAGDHAISIALDSADYLRVENPRLGNFSQT